MSRIYDEGLMEAVRTAARSLKIKLQEGVYIQVAGPNFETPAEIRAYGTLGADVVGMSTAVEAIAANHMGMKICGVSCIANMAAGISKTPLTHAEVQETASRVAPLFKKLITESIIRFNNT
jgi:purine-nucleoside phosphorylase